MDGTCAENHCVKIIDQFLSGEVLADFNSGDEAYPFGFHQAGPAQDNFLLVQFHVGNTVHEQSTDAVGPFVNGHLMASLIQLIGTGQTGGAGTNHGHLLASAPGRGLGGNPTGFPSFVNNGIFNILDRDRRLNHTQHTGALARGRANPSGEFRKIVCLVQTVQGLLPAVAVNKVIPFRNEVVDRTATGHPADKMPGMAEGRSAVHTAGTLLLEMFVSRVDMEFLPVFNPFGGGTFTDRFACDFQKSGWLSHKCWS